MVKKENKLSKKHSLKKPKIIKETLTDNNQNENDNEVVPTNIQESNKLENNFSDNEKKQENLEEDQTENSEKISNKFSENKEENNNVNKFLNTLNKKNKSILKDKKPKGFRAFSLNVEILEAIKKIGYNFPTPIQRKAIPQIMSGFNVISHSRTGSGKTAAFVLPILHRLKEHSKMIGCRCVIVCPTRELAHQTMTFCRKLGKYTNLKYALLVGGNELDGQFERLAQNPDIIIATPGRIMHHLSEGSLSLKRVEILAIDEADKIFELNFEEQLNQILRNCPLSRQVLLFSATIPQQLAQFMKTGIREYKLVNIEEESKLPDRLKMHMIYTISEEKKYALVVLLKNIIKLSESTLVFVPTKYHCEFLHEFLKFWNLHTLYIFGQMDQQLRDDNLDKFRRKRINILIVTDVAARGLDIPVLDNVINFDFPDNEKLFIHRVGRTARAGKEGKVISLLAPADLAYFFDIKHLLGRKLMLNYIDPQNPENKYNKKSIEKALRDFETISIGSVPNKSLSQIKESAKIFLNSRTDMETIEESSVKAYNKMLLFRQKPTGYGVKQSKKIGYIDIHPFFINDQTTSQDELQKQSFLNQLKNFKPKESYFERINETNLKEEIIKEFKTKAEQFKKKKEIEKKKDKLLRQQYQEEAEEIPQDRDNEGASDSLDEDNDESEDEENQNNSHPKNLVNFSEYKTSEKEKNNKNEFLGKKIKRSQVRNFKNNPHFVSERSEGNNKSLWGDEKPISLDELTLNLMPDADDGNKKKMVWDNKKKNFINAKVDKKGRIIKKNEAGVKIKKDDKNPSQFKRWKKKNKATIPRVGEMENELHVANAQTRFKDLKMSRNTKPGATNTGESKTIQQILKDKKDKFKFDQRKVYSKKDFKNKQIADKSHLNRKSFALVKKTQTGKRKK